MKNIEVIKSYLKGIDAKTPKRQIVNGIYEYEGRTLYTRLDGISFKLINYSTTIATYLIDKGADKTIWINENKYSVTTSKIVNMLKNEAEKEGYKILKLNY